MPENKTYTKVNYLRQLGTRSSNAMSGIKFYTEFFMTFILGTIGLWFSHSMNLNWGGVFLESRELLIYGIATIMMLFGHRFFMDDDEDTKGQNVTKFLIFVTFCFAFFFYSKSVLEDPKGFSVYGVVGFVVTVFLWFLNHVNKDCYDDKDNLYNPLGGK